MAMLRTHTAQGMPNEAGIDPAVVVDHGDGLGTDSKWANARAIAAGFPTFSSSSRTS